MGSGEPLDNYDNVLRFIHLLNDPAGQNMGQRHITLSTCGLIEKMYRLAEENLQITLAVSLHAPNDEIRREIMPVAKANPMEKLLAACVDYANHTKRRITFESVSYTHLCSWFSAAQVPRRGTYAVVYH